MGGVRLTEAIDNARQVARVSPGQQRYEITGYQEIPTNHISANQHNPRPSFHLQDNDPYLLDLGASIAATGQHRPALVFEQMGHYELPDNIGHFVLLQGERRWRSCAIAKVDKLSCLVVRTPVTLAEELEWLGIEEAFKEDWQFFFVLKFARRLADELGVPIVSNDIISRTGLKTEDLKVAERLFRLEEPVQRVVQEYEEAAYLARQQKQRGGGRAMSSAKVGEFSAPKAAIVWDIFEELRKKFGYLEMIKQYDDLNLQMRITGKAVQGKATTEDLNGFLSMVRSAEEPYQHGVLTQVDELLTNPSYKVRKFLVSTNHAQVGKYRKMMARIDGLEKSVRAANHHLDQIGTDPDQLAEDLRLVMKLQRELMTLERGIERQHDRHRG